MMPSRIMGPSYSTLIGCWTIDQRCYEWRRNWTLSEAQRVLGKPVLAMRWFSDPAIGLGRSVPCSFVTTQSGFDQVIDLLGRMECGVYW